MHKFDQVTETASTCLMNTQLQHNIQSKAGVTVINLNNLITNYIYSSSPLRPQKRPFSSIFNSSWIPKAAIVVYFIDFR